MTSSVARAHRPILAQTHACTSIEGLLGKPIGSRSLESIRLVRCNDRECTRSKQIVRYGGARWTACSDHVEAKAAEFDRFPGAAAISGDEIGWDFDSTEWNDDHTAITNGDCYITDASVSALRHAMGM